MEWKQVGSCVIFKVADFWGELSNMHNEFGLLVGGVQVDSSEALYQAMRFPHEPSWQQEILEARHAMQAKMKSKKEGRRKDGSRQDWEQVQLAVMRWVLRVKLACNPVRFGRVLRETGSRPIVERSREDRFWGAVEEDGGVLRGENWLGRLLMELRDAYVACPDAEQWRLVQPPEIPGCLLLGQPVGVASDSFGPARCN